MKVFIINAVPYGSTGKIMFSISEMLLSGGDESICATGYSWHKCDKKEHYLIGNIFSKSFHMYMSRLFGNHGCYSLITTDRLIKKIKAFSPDLIHLHNVHGWYLHIPKFFEYLKESGIPIVWTLHDCWAFTGGCSHFTFCGCGKWMNGCGGCNNLGPYPISSKIDRTQKMWQLKKKCFCGFHNMVVVTPSQWLADLVGRSYLQQYPIRVIPNGIDIEIFQPRSSDFRKRQGIRENQHMVLGVSLGWNERKGLDVFIELAKRLPHNYKIVLIGTDENVDKSLPENIISIHRTYNQTELAEIYSAADIFVQTTREENYPTVNMEAIACGTPVLTFNTGGSPEMLDETCGSVVDCDDIDALEKEIVRICSQTPYSEEQCVLKSREFDQNKRFKEYIKLYETVIIPRDQADRAGSLEKI